MNAKATSKKPVIFSWQVTEIKPLKTEQEFKEWEKHMQAYVGLEFTPGSVSISAGTTSCSGGGADDCDMVQH